MKGAESLLPNKIQILHSVVVHYALFYVLYISSTCFNRYENISWEEEDFLKPSIKTRCEKTILKLALEGII